MVRLSWRDSHLVFNYLKDEALYNELDEASLDSVWMPDPQFAFLYNGLQEIFTERSFNTTVCLTLCLTVCLPVCLN